MLQIQTHGGIPEVIRNDLNLYEGDLKQYFKIIFRNSTNIYHPYHNFRHMTHVLLLCHHACIFYKGNLNPRSMRNLLVASLFHDFNHNGSLCDDNLNIVRAVSGLEKYILIEDKDSLYDIIKLIKATEYPHTIVSEELDLCGNIIRDSDLSQALSVAWIQQVIIGLAKEWNKQPIEVLKNQSQYLKNIKFHTQWANDLFSRKIIDEKIKETQELYELVK